MLQQIEKLNSIWVQAEQFNIHARVFNKKLNTKDIVLVHGIGVSSRYFIPLGEYLAPFYNVYIPDLPGFGKSTKPNHTLNLRELAHALYLFTQAAGIKNPILLGNSFGCQIIVDSIDQQPLWASGIILVGPTVEASKRTVKQQIKGWLKNSIKEPFSQLFIIIKDYYDCGIPRLIRTFYYALEDEIEKKLPNIKLPALVVYGGGDKIISRQWVEEVTRLLPMGKLATVPNKGHTVNYNSPKVLAQIVHDFLRSQLSLTE